VFFINGFVWGIIATFGVFLAFYLDNDVFPGATDIDYAFIGGLNFSVAMLMAPVATYTCRRWHFKWTLGVGVTLLGGGFIAASFAKQIWQLFLSQGLIVGMGAGLIYVPSLPIISQWFGKRRALANGITSAGSGVGGLAMSFAIQAMIEDLGISWALRITGIVVFAVNFPATMILRTRDGYVMPNRKMFDLVLLRRYDVFLLLSWAFIMMFGYITLTYSLSAYGRAIGLSASSASYQTAFMNLGIAIGRPLTGLLSDRFGRIEVPGFITFLTGILCFAWWIPAKSFGSLTGFSIGWCHTGNLLACSGTCCDRGGWAEGAAFCIIAGLDDYCFTYNVLGSHCSQAEEAGHDSCLFVPSNLCGSFVCPCKHLHA